MSLTLLGAGQQVDFAVAPNTGVAAFVNLATDGATPMDQVLRFSPPGPAGNAYIFLLKTTVGTPAVNDSATALTFSYKDGISTVGDLEIFLPTTHVSVVTSSASPSTILSGLADPISITFHGGH